MSDINTQQEHLLSRIDEKLDTRHHTGIELKSSNLQLSQPSVAEPLSSYIEEVTYRQTVVGDVDTQVLPVAPDDKQPSSIDGEFGGDEDKLDSTQLSENTAEKSTDANELIDDSAGQFRRRIPDEIPVDNYGETSFWTVEPYVKLLDVIVGPISNGLEPVVDVVSQCR